MCSVLVGGWETRRCSGYPMHLITMNACSPSQKPCATPPPHLSEEQHREQHRCAVLEPTGNEGYQGQGGWGTSGAQRGEERARGVGGLGYKVVATFSNQHWLLQLAASCHMADATPS